MSTRNSGYERVPLDRYITPRWVYEQLWRVDPRFEDAIDVAPVDDDAFDFLTHEWLAPPQFIATNPPFKLAPQFCRRAIEVTKPFNGAVAMLLPHAFDTAKGRRDLWQPPFAGKHVLTTRIRWTNLPQKTAGPSNNHAFYIFDHQHVGPPVLGWL